MTLLAVDKLEVVYHRAVKAVQGITLKAEAGQIVALLGAAFVTLFPYVIEAGLLALPGAQRYADLLFAVNYAAFGLVMILFLIFEPLGLVGIWHRVQNYFLLWPFRHRSAAGAGR